MKELLKKSLALLLMVVMVLGASPLSGFGGLDLHLPEWLKSPFSVDADAADVSDLTYLISEGKVTITDCNTSASGTLTIPATIEGYPVTGIDNRAFCGCSSLTEIEIPSGVISIGDSAFSVCSELESVSFGENSQLTSIGEYAFFGCSSLANIAIPSGVTSIGDSAFSMCIRLESIEIPTGVTSIGNSAFDGCSKLSSIEIPTGVTSIGEEAFFFTGFYNDSSNWVDDVLYIGEYLIGAKTSISGSYTVKPGTKLIADNAFNGCFSLESIEIPSGVTSIGEQAFYLCGGLANIEIPSGVIRIGDGAFYNTAFYNNSSNWVDDVLYIGEYLIEAKDSISGSYTVKPDTKLIADNAFNGCISLESIEIPSGVTSIGNSAFDGCSKLTSIEIPSSVTSIGNSAFDGCSSLESVGFGENSQLTNIGNSAFDGCSKLTSIEIPSGVTSIGDDAFGLCFSLASIIIPSGVTGIGYMAFNGCISLESITVAADNVSYSSDERGVLFNKSKTILIQYPRGNTATSYTIPSSVTSIGDSAFSWCDSLERIEIPSGVTSIGEEAFYLCGSLTSIEIPSAVTSIGDLAFFSYSLNRITVAADNANYSSDDRGVLFNKSKTELIQYPIGNTATSYTILSSVTSIGDDAFGICFSLASIEIPSGVTSIGEYAFFGCSSLANIAIPSGVTSIGEEAFFLTGFYNDSSNWVDDVLYIGEYLIGAKTSISGSYTVKPGTKLIADNAFNGCFSLESIEIPSGVTSIGDWAFVDCDSLTRLHIPPSVTTIGSNLLSSGSACIICSTTETAYAKTYADNNDFTFEVCTGYETVVNVEGVEIDDSCKTIFMYSGSTQQLLCSVTPSGATNKTVTWSSSNNAVATVSAAGVVTAVGAGAATITVTTEDGNKTATCEVTVICPTIAIKNPNNSASVNYGDTLRLTAVTDMPAGSKIVWSVQGTGVSLKASEDGMTCEVTSTGNGMVTVTAKIVDAAGNPITDANSKEISASQQIKSNAGFFQKLIAFFKKLFGSTRIIVQAIDE